MPDNADSQRLERYRRVVEAAWAEERVSAQVLRERFPEETPQFISRLLGQLAQDGHLLEDGPAAFRWPQARERRQVETWLESKVLGPRMTRTPEADRPRERLLALGPSALRAAELLAILIRSGRPGESALAAGEKIAARFSDHLERLADAGRGELKEISPSVAEAAYCQIMAGIELGRRIERLARRQDGKIPLRIRHTSDAAEYCRQTFERLAQDATQEEFRLVCLDTRHQVIGTHVISIGLLNQSLVAPREVFRPAIRDAAAAVILVHNHPSGDPSPSAEDLAVTRRLEGAAVALGIKLLDHIIVARRGCISLREHESNS